MVAVPLYRLYPQPISSEPPKNDVKLSSAELQCTGCATLEAEAPRSRVSKSICEQSSSAHLNMFPLWPRLAKRSS